MALDGMTRELTAADMVPGAVIRLHQDGNVVAPFSDSVVIGRVSPVQKYQGEEYK